MQWLHILALAIVQGISEFLPISSDGHLIVTNAVAEALGATPFKNVLTVEIMLHAGTLVAILVVYWKRLIALLGEDRRLLTRLVIGTLPAVVVGLPIKSIPELRAWVESPLLAGVCLPLTGLLLLVSRRFLDGKTDYRDLTLWQAFLIGVAQSIAILPGISRSGCTIVAGLALGLRRDSAATFSFLLATPVTAGAVFLGLKDLAEGEPVGASLGALAMGAVVSCVVGLFALRWILGWLERGKLHYFTAWCVVLGLGVLAWQLSIGPKS